jgi:pentatricopeptide repeat protein
VQPGDRIVAVDSSLGDRMWPVSTNEGLISAVTSRLPGQKITFRFERSAIGTNNDFVDATTIIGNGESAPIDAGATSETATMFSPVTTKSVSPSITSLSSDISNAGNDAASISAPASGYDEDLLNRCQEVIQRYKNAEKYVNKFSLPGVVADKVVYALASAKTKVDDVTLSMIMTAYLSCRQPEMAIRVFEATVGLRADGIKGEIESVSSNTDLESDPLSGKDGNQIVPDVCALDVYTAGALLKAHSMNGDLVAMQRVLSVLEGHGGVKMEDFEIASWPGTHYEGSLKPDNQCYNIAITAAANSDAEEGLELAKIMFNRLSDPGKNERLVKDIVSYNAIIKALTKFGEFEEAIETFYQLKKAGIKPDKYTYTALAKAVILDDNDVEELLYDMREEGVTADVMTFNTIIRYLCEQKKLSAARKVINFMEGSGIPPDSWTYGFLMKGLLASDNPSACLTLFESACSDRRTVGLTENVYLYTTAMTAAAAMGDHTRALELLSRMNSLGIKANIKTMTALLSACLSAEEPELAVDIYRRIPNPDSYAVSKGIMALSLAGKGDEALDMLSEKGTVAERIQGKYLNNIYVSLFQNSIKADDYELARRVLKSLMGKGNIPSKVIFQRIFESMSLTLKEGLVAKISYSESGFVRRRSLGDKDAEKFKFLLFLVDSLADRNLPCEASLYATTLQFGNHLGGLPRKIAALLVSAKAASEVYGSEKMKLMDEGSSCETECLVLGWEDLYQSFDEIRSQMEGPMSLPKIQVRIASKELSRVLKAEKNLSFRKRSLV